jgi:hypothetical protein
MLSIGRVSTADTNTGGPCCREHRGNRYGDVTGRWLIRCEKSGRAQRLDRVWRKCQGDGDAGIGLCINVMQRPPCAGFWSGRGLDERCRTARCGRQGGGFGHGRGLRFPFAGHSGKIRPAGGRRQECSLRELWWVPAGGPFNCPAFSGGLSPTSAEREAKSAVVITCSANANSIAPLYVFVIFRFFVIFRLSSAEIQNATVGKVNTIIRTHTPRKPPISPCLNATDTPPPASTPSRRRTASLKPTPWKFACVPSVELAR